MAAEIIEEFGDQLDSIMLISSEGGRFEVAVNGQQVFSKKETQRHPAADEVIDNIKKQLASSTPGQQASAWQG